MKNYNIGTCSDTGQVRQVNEDSMAMFESPNGTVLVVCDGMGGQNAGDVASQLAVAVIRDILSDNTFASPEESITQSVMAANQAILNRAAQSPNLSGMGSTCVMLIIKDGKVYYGSVGDSRIYYLTPSGDIRQLTRDQSYVQALVDAGEITAADAEHHQDKNQITNALGIETMTPPVVSPAPVIPEAGSVFLLCSDGLTNMVNAPEIASLLQRKDVPVQQKAEALVKAANSAGGTDNITVQIVEFTGGSEAHTVAPGVSASGAVIKKEIKRNRAITYALAIFTVLIIAGAATYFFYPDSNSKKEQEKNTVTAQPKQEVKNQPETKTAPTQTEKIIVVEQERAKPEPRTKGSKSVIQKSAGKQSSDPKVRKAIVNSDGENPKTDQQSGGNPEENPIIRKGVIEKDD